MVSEQTINKIMSVMIVIILAMTSSFATYRRTKLRIYGGRNLNNDAFQFVVVIAYVPRPSWVKRYCTGSLITEAWVLTAGHCIKQFAQWEFILNHTRVFFGNLTAAPETIDNSRKVIYQATQYVHKNLIQVENFKLKYSLRNDIGLLMIESLLDVKPGRLSSHDYRTFIGQSAHYIGGGYTSPDFFTNLVDIEEEDRKRPLQIGEAVIAKCESQDYYYDSIHFAKLRMDAAFLCVHSTCASKNQQMRKGDSGGPLIHNGQIVGLASAVINKYDSIFSAVSPYLDWIQYIISTHKPNLETNTI